MGGGRRFQVKSQATLLGEPWDSLEASLKKHRRKEDSPSGRVARKQPRMECRICSPTEILHAVQSLYDDQLRPYGRILRKRLTEHATNCGYKIDADLTRLRSACEAVSELRIEAESGGEWSALFAGHPSKFIDVYCPSDVYTNKLWTGLSTYCLTLTGKDAILPGGRYACAQMLVQRGLTFLQGLCLGQVCHVVQLAISQKKILGYLEGSITPYASSHSMAKDNAAALQSPCAADEVNSVATWQNVRFWVKEILLESDSSVALSNLKRIFRSKYNVELSETALGHAKLSELLQDSRFEGICKVQLLEQGYFVIPRFVKPQPELPFAHNSLAWDYKDFIRNTFIHVKPQSRSSQRRSRSLPVSTHDVAKREHRSVSENLSCGKV